MTSRRSVRRTTTLIQVEILEELLDFAYSDEGANNPEEKLIAEEEAGDLVLSINEVAGQVVVEIFRN